MIKEAELWDIFEISDMWFAMMEEVYPSKERNEEKFCLALILKIYQKEYVILLKLDDDNDEIAGFIMGFADIEEYCTEVVGKCEHLYVKKEYRNKGYDEELIDDFILEMKRLGVKQAKFMTTDKLAPYWERKGYERQDVLLGKEI